MSWITGIPGNSNNIFQDKSMTITFLFFQTYVSCAFKKGKQMPKGERSIVTIYSRSGRNKAVCSILIIFTITICIQLSFSNSVQSDPITGAGTDVVNGTVEFTDRIDINTTRVTINITDWNNITILDDLILSIENNTWTYKWVTTRVDDGFYTVSIKTYNSSSLINIETTVYNVDNIKPSSDSSPDNKILIGIILILIFIIIEAVIILLERKYRNKVFFSLSLDPKQVTYNIPDLAIINIFLFLIVIGTVFTIITPQIENELLLTAFIILNGITILTGFWALTHKCLALKIALALFFAIIWTFIISLLTETYINHPTEIGSLNIIVGMTLGISILIIYLLIFCLIILNKRSSDVRKGISLGTIILTLIFLGTIGLTQLLAYFGIFFWENIFYICLIFSGLIPIGTWMIYRWDLVYFETREESRTNNSRNMTFNMFNIEKSGNKYLKKEYKKFNLAKISYKLTFDDNIKISMITVKGDWDSNRDLALLLMQKFVKMTYKLSNIDNGSVAIRIYQSDDDFDSKLNLCQSFGFAVEKKKKGVDNSYYQLKLRSDRGIFSKRV